MRRESSIVSCKYERSQLSKPLLLCLIAPGLMDSAEFVQHNHVPATFYIIHTDKTEGF